MYVDDTPLTYAFIIKNDDWTELTDTLGQSLDEENFTTETADALRVLTDVYNYAVTRI